MPAAMARHAFLLAAEERGWTSTSTPVPPARVEVDLVRVLHLELVRPTGRPDEVGIVPGPGVALVLHLDA